MTDDPTLRALEYELAQAHGTKPGGQSPNPAKIAMIEDAIRAHTGRRKPGRPRKETADATDLLENTDA